MIRGRSWDNCGPGSCVLDDNGVACDLEVNWIRVSEGFGGVCGLRGFPRRWCLVLEMTWMMMRSSSGKCGVGVTWMKVRLSPGW